MSTFVLRTQGHKRKTNNRISLPQVGFMPGSIRRVLELFENEAFTIRFLQLFTNPKSPSLSDPKPQFLSVLTNKVSIFYLHGMGYCYCVITTRLSGCPEGTADRRSDIGHYSAGGYRPDGGSGRVRMMMNDMGFGDLKGAVKAEEKVAGAGANYNSDLSKDMSKIRGFDMCFPGFKRLASVRSSQNHQHEPA